MNYEDDIRNDEFSNTMTCLLSEDFWREYLRLEMFAYYGMNDKNALMRPKFLQDLAEGIHVLLGAYIFAGYDGNFSKYYKNDLIYLKARYDFQQITKAETISLVTKELPPAGGLIEHGI